MNLFFELLQVAVGTRQSLSRVPTAREWGELYNMATRQALVGVCFVGLQRLSYDDDTAVAYDNDNKATANLPETLRLRWLGMAAKIQQKNRVLNEACASLCKDLAHDGLYACILKGQSNLVNYPEKLRDCRTPGDIDVWCGLMDPEGIDIAVADLDGRGAHYEKYHDERGVIEWVLADYRIRDKKKPEVLYHHVDWEYKGIECEVHFKPSWMNCPWHNRRLQRWCKENEQWNTCEYNGFNIPSVEFNAVYQLVHIYRHLFNEGIGLRQLLDYYFVLEKTPPTPLFRGELLKTIKSFGMVKFFFAVLWVIREVFDPNLDFAVWEKACHDNSICFPNLGSLRKEGELGEGLGEFLLNEIMLAGNFGKYDERNVISANEGYVKRFARRQRRFLRFLGQYPSEVIWGPWFSVKQRMRRMWHGWR